MARESALTMWREYGVFRVSPQGFHSQAIQAAVVFRARVLALTGEDLLIESAGLPEELDALEDLLKDFGLAGVVRTGPIAVLADPGELRSPRL